MDVREAAVLEDAAEREAPRGSEAEVRDAVGYAEPAFRSGSAARPLLARLGSQSETGKFFTERDYPILNQDVLQRTCYRNNPIESDSRGS